MSSPGVIRDLELKTQRSRLLIISFIILASCIFSFEPAFALTADPMDLSVGARSLGMGKAYVAVAEDSETVFVNPAGLGAISSLKLGSMYTSLFNDDISYAVLSCAYPLDKDSGTLGAGLINQSVSGIKLLDVTGTVESTGSYGSQVFFISHGLNLSKKFLPGMKELYGGYTIKYFIQSAAGSGTSGMNGNGLSADIGLLYKPKGFMSYGLTLQNILAGTITYQSGAEDSIGSAAKVGTKVSVMGDTLDGGAILQSDSKLDVALDADMGISYKVPGTLHLGVEYKPQLGINYIDNILTLRGGINQVPTPAGNLNNLTLGVGINYQGTEFNFAYCPSYGDIPESATYFFSLSYIGVPKAEKPVEEMKPLIGQLMPEDKIVTRDNALLVQGTVTDPTNIYKVEINGAGVKVSDTGTFEMNVPLQVTGKHLVTVRATDLKGKSEEHKLRVVRIVSFADVADNHWAVDPVGKLATVGLVEGYPDGTFQPERALSRAELATLLVKAKGEEPPPVTGRVFKDVAASHWASRYINGALEMGLVMGYPDKTFRPNNKINRTEGVVVLSRFGELKEAVQLEAGPYPDLTAKYWASPFIAAAKDAGLLDYLGDTDFGPKKELTRAEAVEILSKTTYGRAQIDSLLDWTVGFEPGTGKVAAAAPGIAAPRYAAKPAATFKIKEFADVPDEYWASDSIKYLATANVMGGYPDGSFKPDRIVTRAELSSILVKAKGLPLPKIFMSSYSDLPKNSWAAPYVKAAVDVGYVTGKKGGKFEPNRGATRAEAVAALVTFDNLQIPSDLRRGPFPDMTAREWGANYVAAAKDAGMLEYLKGQDFEAGKSITRGELAEILAKTTYGQAKINQIKSAAAFQ